MKALFSIKYSLSALVSATIKTGTCPCRKILVTGEKEKEAAGVRSLPQAQTSPRGPLHFFVSL
jgi:hypothetical protein